MSGAGPRTCVLSRFGRRSPSTGRPWYKGKASCILVGNVGELIGGIEVFKDARPDDGMLDVGLATADGLLEWARVVARTAVGSIARRRPSPASRRPGP